jgi:hypothetical protein
MAVLAGPFLKGHNEMANVSDETRDIANGALSVSDGGLTYKISLGMYLISQLRGYGFLYSWFEVNLGC